MSRFLLSKGVADPGNVNRQAEALLDMTLTKKGYV